MTKIEVPQPLKFIALFDIHCGWEKQNIRGKTVTRPTHNKEAIKAAILFAKDFTPDVLVLGGDQVNCGPISHWHHGRPILTEGLRLKDEYELLDELILSPLQSVKRKIWHTGNHEAWLTQHIEANPGLEGMIEPENYLRLVSRGYELYSQGEISKIGKLHFVHGDVALRRGGGVNPARKIVLLYRRNIRAGHIHTHSVATETTAIDSQDFHTGVIVPSLSTRNPTYNKSAPNNSMCGFNFGYVYPDGNFSDYVPIINNGVVTINGKKYDGKKKD